MPKNCHQNVWANLVSMSTHFQGVMFAGINLFLRFHAFSLFLIIPLLLSGLGLFLLVFSFFFLWILSACHIWMKWMNEPEDPFGDRLHSGGTKCQPKLIGLVCPTPGFFVVCHHHHHHHHHPVLHVWRMGPCSGRKDIFRECDWRSLAQVTSIRGDSARFSVIKKISGQTVGW